MNNNDIDNSHLLSRPKHVKDVRYTIFDGLEANNKFIIIDGKRYNYELSGTLGLDYGGDIINISELNGKFYAYKIPMSNPQPLVEIKIKGEWDRENGK